MSNTCATVMSNNYLIQTTNMNAKVANKILEINAGREWLTTKAANEARLQKAYNDINWTYREGNKIQARYDGQVSVNDMRTIGITVSDNGDASWWANNHVPYNGVVTKTRKGYGGCCYFAGEVDKMACHCGKEKDCGCNCVGLPGGQDCNRSLNSNMFQQFINRDRAWWENNLSASTAAARRKYDEAKSTYQNTPQMQPVEVGCCQSLSIGDILAKSVTIQGNQLICN